MVFTKKFDRAFQWAGEKMGGEAKTTYSDHFKTLESEMTLRHDGTEKLQKSMNAYMKWLSRKGDTFEDKDRSTPTASLGRNMVSHGEELDTDSELGNCLVSLGRANERVAGMQDTYLENASATWMNQLERNLAMMKEYSSARKKLETRRLAFDASTARMTKARRDDFRVEEEVRMNRAKFEESEEDVYRRMQDIRESEADSMTALTAFLESELEFHERATEELRRVRSQWAKSAGALPRSQPKTRSRSNTARSWQEPRHSAVYEEEPEQEVPHLPTRPSHSRAGPPPLPQQPRPSVKRAVTSDGRLAPTPLAGNVPPVPQLSLNRVQTDRGTYLDHDRNDVFLDDGSSNNSGSASPGYTERSASPATSYGSLSRTASAVALKKPPPPPPVNRAKKPPPPPPSRKITLG